jgi:hypothetical protein
MNMNIEGYPKDAVLDEVSPSSNDEFADTNEAGENEITLEAIEISSAPLSRKENIVKTQQAVQKRIWGDADKVKIRSKVDIRTTTTHTSNTNPGLVGNGNLERNVKISREFEEGI